MKQKEGRFTKHSRNSVLPSLKKKTDRYKMLQKKFC